MNKKMIVQIVIIVVALGAAGFILYKGLFNSAGQQTPSNSAQVTPVQVSQLLPYGSTLDFSQLHKRPFQYNQPQPPSLNPSSEVGVNENVLIINPDSSSSAAPGR